MKYLIILFVTILSTSFAKAQNTELNKSYFIDAKQQLENMLNGNEQPNFEKAIFIIENAWYENQIDKTSFDNAIDVKVSAIKQLVKNNYDAEVFKKELNSLRRKPNAEALYDKALTNWAIYSYITNTTIFENANEIVYHTPCTYSFADPMATEDWRNSQVVNLNNTKQGNCFALASLYKILSNRLNSDAKLCTAPSHIFISHEDEKGISYNIELGSRKFPGTGTLATLTHSSVESIRSDIAMRRLTEQQSVALCLVYLAKGYQHKFNIISDGFMMDCATTSLKFDSLNLNAMLLKSELLENQFIHSSKSITQLRNELKFIEYEKLIANLYQLGYREIPLEMKNQLIKGWSKDTVKSLADKNYKAAEVKTAQLLQSRQASISWGLFDEEFTYKPVERYGNTLFDCKSKKIKQFVKEQNLYNHYNFDPVVFAWNIDPMAHKYPMLSPYCFVANNPIQYIDPDGRELVDPNGKRVTVTHNKNGSLKFSKNATSDIIRVANALNQTGEGRSQLTKVTQSDIKVKINISSETNIEKKSDGNHYTYGTTLQGNMNEADNYGRKENADGTYGIKEATITIFEGTIKADAETSNPRLAGLTTEQSIGAIAGHEIVHATDKKEINKDLKAEQAGGKDAKAREISREIKPEQVENKIKEESNN